MIDKSPDAFRTISEAAEDLDLPQHVLRFWETRFTQIKPLKRGGGRRYYRPDDVEFLRGLKHLLHAEKYTIKGVQKIIKEQGQKAIQVAGRTMAAPQDHASARPIVAAVSTAPAAEPTPVQKAVVQRTLAQPREAMPATARGKLEQALAELLECRRVIAALQHA